MDFLVNKSKPSDHAHLPETHSHTPGHSRPIPKQDMKTIEAQLVNHIDVQRKKKMAEEELLQLDPWDISARKKLNDMSESSYSTGSEMFYSFDLLNQGAEKSDHSPKGVASRVSDFHSDGRGVGLEQPPSSRLHPPTTNKPSSCSVADDVCVYSFAFGGFTCAVLENRPVHTHITRSNGRVSGGSDNTSETDSYSSAKADADPNSLCSSELCSLDEGGLDPFKYFDCVKDILKGRVGRREIKSCENKLGQVLPADHLL